MKRVPIEVPATISALIAMALGAMSGCSSLSYDAVGKATISGTLEVRWIKPDRFIYVPLAEDPLVVVMSDKRIIKPQRIYTDGGSIPRLAWGIPGFSPWGYAPAYVMHDWVFAAHHCNFDEYKSVSFDDSARYLAEAIKALMEAGVAAKDEATLLAIYAGVRTPLAKSIWDTPGCNLPEPTEAAPADQGVLVRTIKFPK
jgi:hypothetical protein